MTAIKLARAVAATASLLVLAGCQQGNVTASYHSPNASATGGPVRTGAGWTATGIDGTIPPANTCHLRHTADSQPLQDPICTPGAVDEAVTPDTLSTTICRRGGYTASVRPPRQLTDPVKQQLLAAYGQPASQRSTYELDHLVHLSLGGSSDIRNLWPEPNILTLPVGNSSYFNNDKDVVVIYLFHAVCDHRADLNAAQQAIATDWTTAIDQLGLPPIPRSVAVTV